MIPLGELRRRHAHPGAVAWIGLRPARKVEILPRDEVEITAAGLEGDHGRAGKRAVTLMQAEHLPVVAALTGRQVTPDLLRRNLVVSGLNLAACREGALQVGEAVLEITGACPPCSRMEAALGHGGYTALRGHGGWYAQVRVPGRVRLGASVIHIPREGIRSKSAADRSALLPGQGRIGGGPPSADSGLCGHPDSRQYLVPPRLSTSTFSISGIVSAFEKTHARTRL
jgi:MOSC domain-containing protein YiiM